MPTATFDACKLLISNKKLNRQKENEEILEKQLKRSSRNKISNQNILSNDYDLN
jgi:hypothetical protein